MWRWLKRFWSWYSYRMFLFRAGVSDDWIRQAFSYVVDCRETDEFMPFYDVVGQFDFKAIGDYIHIRDTIWDWEGVIQEGIDGSIVVQEYSKEKKYREIGGGFDGACYNLPSNWKEVFRTGRLCESDKFVYYLRAFYGKGK